MSELPKIVRARLQARPAEAHPDADVLTAFYEQVLPEKEREPLLAHLAECSECRDVVGTALPQVEEARVIVAHPASAWGWPQMVRWGSVVACLVVVGAAVSIWHPGTSEVARPKSETGVMEQQDELADAAKGKAAASEPASAQHLRVDSYEQEQKSPVALTEKRVTSPRAPAKTTRIEPSQVDRKKAASEPAAKSTLDRSATAFSTSGTFSRMPQSGTALARALPAPAPPAMKSESVEVASDQTVNPVEPSVAASDVKTDTPGRAKAGAAASANQAAAPEANAPILAQSFSKEAQASPAGQPSLTKMAAQFELSPEGQLRRSFDSGKTWEAVPLVERVTFNALAVMGPEVWVGGAAGLLYHSADNGRQWKPVKPSVAGVALTADIMNVRFTDMQHLAVMTSDGQVWTTVDGGQNWQRNR